LASTLEMKLTFFFFSFGFVVYQSCICELFYVTSVVFMQKTAVKTYTSPTSPDIEILRFSVNILPLNFIVHQLPGAQNSRFFSSWISPLTSMSYKLIAIKFLEHGSKFLGCPFRILSACFPFDVDRRLLIQSVRESDLLMLEGSVTADC
jgi:hypothetical protein